MCLARPPAQHSRSMLNHDESAREQVSAHIMCARRTWSSFQTGSTIKQVQPFPHMDMKARQLYAALARLPARNDALVVTTNIVCLIKPVFSIFLSPTWPQTILQVALPCKLLTSHRSGRYNLHLGRTLTHGHPTTLQSNRDPSTGWYRRRRRNGTTNQY